MYIFCLVDILVEYEKTVCSLIVLFVLGKSIFSNRFVCFLKTRRVFEQLKGIYFMFPWRKPCRIVS